MKSIPVKKFLRQFRIHHYIAFALLAAIGIFNAVTALEPVIKQHNREKNIERTFAQWWDEEGAAQFEAVGLKADEKTRNEEFVQYRERYLKQNRTFIVEDRIAEMPTEFRDWWEVGGGKEMFIQEHGKYPDERDFEREKDKWIKQYTDKFVRYGLAFVPKYSEYERFCTSWLLSPNVFSFLIFLGFFLFAYVQLSSRWGIPVVIACFAGLIFVTGFSVDTLCGTSFFDHFSTERYMGASGILAFFLGATAFGLSKGAVSNKVRGVAILGFLLDLLVNLFIVKGIFYAVAFTSILFFGVGFAAGMKIPNRKKSAREMQEESLAERMSKASGNPIAERKKKIRTQIEEGFQEASKGRFPAAEQKLSPAMTALLQEQPIDFDAVNRLAERMVSPSLYIDVAGAQWIEWGNMAKSRNCPEAALLLLEKGLLSEKNMGAARRTLFNIGEIRILKELNREEGIARLNKVIELNDKDILAIQARKLLEKAKGKA